MDKNKTGLIWGIIGVVAGVAAAVGGAYTLGKNSNYIAIGTNDEEDYDEENVTVE